MGFIIHQKYTIVKTPHCYGVLLVDDFVVGVDFFVGVVETGFVVLESTGVLVAAWVSIIGAFAFLSISFSLNESIKTSDIRPKIITPQNPTITLSKCPLNIGIL